MDQHNRFENYSATFLNSNKVWISHILLLVKKFYLVIVGCFLMLSLLLIKYQFAAGGNKKIPPAVYKNIVADDTITLAVVGDLMCHSQQFITAKKDSGYDFNNVYSAVQSYLSDADLTFGNLETVTAGETQGGYTGYPTFNTPVAYLDALKNAGFDVLTNANNHSLDRRFLGVEKTIDALNERSFFHTGTFKTVEESNKILVVNAHGIKLAILAYTFGTNGIPFDKGKEFSVNLIDSAKMKNDVEAAKQTGADKILAFVHWGEEYQRQPNDYQKKYAGLLNQFGVDMILGSHPHVLEPMEILKNPTTGKTTFVIYSLGNFISAQRKIYTDNGIILRLQLIKNNSTGQTHLGTVNFIPTYVSVKNGFRILPVRKAIDAYNSGDNSLGVSADEMSRIQEVWNEATTHLTDSNNNILPLQ